MAITRTYTHARLTKKFKCFSTLSQVRYCLLIRKRDPSGDLDRTRQLIPPLVRINVVEDFENGRKSDLKSVVVTNFWKVAGCPGRPFTRAKYDANVHSNAVANSNRPKAEGTREAGGNEGEKKENKREWAQGANISAISRRRNAPFSWGGLSSARESGSRGGVPFCDTTVSAGSRIDAGRQRGGTHEKAGTARNLTSNGV